MPSSETDSKESTSDTHQVLGLAVGLGVGIPVVLVILVMWFVTIRHRRMAKAEDERHKAIDLDAEVSVSEEKQRRHRPVPGSMTYLAKQHAASQRSLNNAGQNSANRLSLPNVRNEHALSMVSHDSHNRPPESLIYTPYTQEEATSSLDNLTRDLNNLDAPKYPRMQGLRSSGSSLSLNRDDRSYLTFTSDAQSIDGRSGIHSPIPSKKTAGPASSSSTLKPPKDVTPPRLEDSRVPSTLKEEEEYPRRSPFGDDDTFSFDDDSRDMSRDIGRDISSEDEDDHNSVSSFRSDEEDGTFDQSHHPMHDETRSLNKNDSLTDSNRFSFNEPPRPHNNSFGSSKVEDQLMVNNSHTTASIYDDSADMEESSTPQGPVYTAESALPDQHIILDESSHGQELTNSTGGDPHLHTPGAEDLARPRVPKVEPRVVSSVYDYPAVASYFTNDGPQNASQSTDWQPVTPQTQNDGFDYHLESSPLSPSSPLHSVPSITGISRIQGSGSAPNSRKGSMSEFMHDVPHINQPINGAPGSPKHLKRKVSGQKGSPVIPSQAHFDNSVFLEKPKKFGNRAAGRQKLPSASQMGI